MGKINKYLINLWNDVRKYFKLNIIAMIIIVVLTSLMTMWLLPGEKNTNDIVTQKYTELAKNYDDATGMYKNEAKALELQKEINDIQQGKTVTKLVKVAVIAAVLIVLIGLLATLLQYIYTDLPFTRWIYGGAPAQLSQSMPVLAAALVSATIIVGIVFYAVFAGG